METTNPHKNVFGEPALSVKLKVEKKSSWFDTTLLNRESGESRHGAIKIPEKQLSGAIEPARWKMLFLIILALFGLFGARVWYLSVYSGDTYRLHAEENRVRLVPLLPARGKIFDREGKVLADNKPLYLLSIEGNDWLRLKVDEQESILTILKNKGVRIDSATLREELKKKPQAFIAELTFSEALSFMTLTPTLKGVNVFIASRRQYSDPTVFSHILGYVSPITPEEYDEFHEQYLINDVIGQVGIEREYESLLRGALGRKSIEVDANGKEAKIVSIDQPKNGTDITLTIDGEMQKKLFTIMKRHLNSKGLKRGAAVVMNPANGDILSFVSLPSYDTQTLYQGISSEDLKRVLSDNDKPLFNRVTNGQYPPGSTFKVIVASAGLEDDVITARTSIVSSGGIRVAQWFFADWKQGGHGVTNLYKAIAESVNTYFYMLGGGFQDKKGIGVERITEEAKRFGLASKTEVDLPDEAEGFLPSPSWKESVKKEQWYIGDTYNLSIGQGDVLVTPLQLASVYSTIALDGVALRPHLLKLDEQTSDAYAAKKRRVIAPAIAKELQHALRQTVLSGSAQRLLSVPLAVAGKTGTAEWHSARNPHAWFVGYAPYANPEVVIAIIVEEGGEGTATAVPIAEEFFTWYGS